MRRTTPEQLFAASCHVIDEGAIDVCTANADRIEERVCICNKILLVSELVRNDLRIANLGQHHQAARYSDSFSSCTCTHEAYTDPF